MCECYSIYFFCCRLLQCKRKRWPISLKLSRKSYLMFMRKQRETIDRRHFLALLQALTGFGGAIESKSPSQFIGTIITYSTSQEGQNCLKSLFKIMKSVQKWLTFGEKYKALENSSDLDFDKIDVGSLPEIMTVRDQLIYSLQLFQLRLSDHLKLTRQDRMVMWVVANMS